MQNDGAFCISFIFEQPPPLSVYIDANLHQLLGTTDISSMPRNFEKVQN
jgi:hypothetical protein